MKSENMRTLKLFFAIALLVCLTLIPYGLKVN